MPYLKLAVEGGGEVELSGNDAAAFDKAIQKHGKIAVPNHALTYIAAFFARRKTHIAMQKAKQLGDADTAARHAAELDGLDETEEAAKEAYDKAVASGGPDLPAHPLTGDEGGAAAAAAAMEKLKVDDAAAAKGGDEEEEKLTKIQIKKMKPAELKDALKERGLSIQGNKNDLAARLLEHEGL